MSWEIKKLNECCISIADGDHLPPPKSESGVPFVTIANVDSYNQFDFTNTMFVPQSYYDKLDGKRKARTGDILLTVVGSFGIPILITDDTPFVFQRHIAILRPDPQVIDSRFLYYTMFSKSFYAQADAYAIGAAQRTISLTSLRQMKVAVPDLDTQGRIADALSLFDNLIDNNNKQISTLEQMAENLYKEWFVSFRFPGHENVEYDGKIPAGWEKASLDSVLSKIATGLNPRKNFVLGEGNNYYVTIKNMGDNNIYLDEKCDKVDDEAIRKINNRSDLQQGDLLFSGIGTIGRVYLINIPTDNWNISESVFTMRPNQKVSSEFLYLLLLSKDVQNYCQSNANGAAQKGIRMADLKKYSFWLAPKPILDDFTKTVKPIIEQVDLIRKANLNLIKQRDLLLPRLMSGKLEV